nr:hypothetical protein [Tanacetum cinerariifolium]
MEDTMLELVKICQEKEFLCIHDDVDDLIESALNSKLLLINLNFQRLDKKEQEVKNVIEQPVECGNRNIQSLQNFRVVHKSSISSNTSQISSIHAIAPFLSTKEPEHLLSMGYEHLSITLETESDEVIESNAENLLPIPSKCEVTLEDKRECDLSIFENSPVCDILSNSKIDDDISVYDNDFEDIEYVEASLSDPEIISVEGENDVEEENVVQQEEEEFDLEDISQIQDVVLREKLLSIIRLIANIESLNDNSTPDHVLNSFMSDNSLLENFSPEFETFCDHTEDMRSGYDCQQQFPFVHEQELSYNQNYDGNYYSHDLPSFPCCDNYGGSHETFQCQPITYQIDFSGSDQIQTPQYPEIHLPSQETSDEVFQANHSIQSEESLKNPSNEIAASNPNEEKEESPQNSDMRQLIREECCVEVPKKQKRSMEDTMLELVKICQEKEFLCIHDNVDDLIKSALNSKLLSIKS